MVISFLLSVNVLGAEIQHQHNHHIHSVTHHKSKTHQVMKKHSRLNKKHVKHPKQSTKHSPIANAVPAYLLASNTSATPRQNSLVEFVQAAIRKIHFNNYQLGGTRFDPSHGIFNLDCSSYVDRVLHEVNPHAFWNLVRRTGSDKPTSLHYYDFFSKLPGANQHDWSRIEQVSQLKPGDILVFRYKKYHNNAMGHVMIVMDRPERDEADNYLLRVTDAAEMGHSQDTRSSHASGIGIGTMLLKADTRTDEPLAYAWKVGSHLKNNVNIIMGRPPNEG